MKDPYGAGWTTSKDIASCCFQKLRVGFVEVLCHGSHQGEKGGRLLLFRDLLDTIQDRGICFRLFVLWIGHDG